MLEGDDKASQLLRELLDETTKVLIRSLPAVKAISSTVVETIFVPRAIARQLVLAIALETGAVTVTQIWLIFRALMANFSSRARLIRQLQQQQRAAQTQDEWMDIAEQIDNIQGNDVWRSEPTCALYECDRISSRIDEFVHLMRRRDIFDLMFTIRGGIARNKFGLLHEGLFSKALAGTKVLVETYHNVVCAALDFVSDAPVMPGDDPIPTEARLAFFNETRHSYGRTAMMFSGGAALGFFHVGVAKALMENGLMPRVLSGASAGSIVCAMIATRTDEECHRDFFQGKGTDAPGHSGELKIDFFRPVGHAAAEAQRRANGHHHESAIGEVLHNPAGAFHDIKRTWQIFVPNSLRNITSFIFDVLAGHRRPQDMLKNDTEHFRGCCRANIGNFTFQEAFDRTGRILNITVCPQNRSDPPRLLNYLTAPHVLVWSAAVASSSLPGVFEANKLLVKDADGTIRYESASGMRFQDGSMEADLPMQQLSEMFNINHFIISQANPHAVFFASFNLDLSVWTNKITGLTHGILLFLRNQIRAWFRNVVEMIGGRRIAPLWDTRRGFGSQFFTQEYEGRDCDISLIPWKNYMSLFSAFLHCLYNPSPDEYHDWILGAERETWRHIPAIKSHCAEEMTLDRCVQRLRKRLLKESWEKHAMGISKEATTNEKMGQRVPSFFTSPSLVNMGGLAIGDRSSLPDLEEEGETDREGQAVLNGPKAPSSGHHIEIKSGWGGMGLRGNHSYGSLARSTSGGSGLFFMDGEDDDEEATGGDQVPGELPDIPRPASHSKILENPESQYIKTTSMANFYYRKTKSHENFLLSSSGEPDSTSAAQVKDSSHARRRSKSAMELSDPSTAAYF